MIILCVLYIYIYGPGQRPATPFPHGIHPSHTSFHAGGLAIDHHPCAILTCWPHATYTLPK